MKKIAISALFVVHLCLFTSCDVSAHDQISDDIKLSLSDIDYTDSCDEFDSIGDDMSKSGMEVEAPKPISNMQYLMRRVGSPIVLKYLALKIYISSWWTRLTGN